LQLISAGLTELGAVAKGSGVKVLMETHGDLVHAQDIAKVMTAAGNQDTIGLVWDISNMWSVTKESPTMVYGLIKKWIMHTHLKDLKSVNGKDQYTLFGDGEVPAFEAIDLLSKNSYPGFYSFEWEKMWHPEIAEPEIALADFPKKMKAHFKS
ncbi:MAG TPA: TIM barrel protein, partial [Flavitalea sp.]|nr:TIM barrel protein [Flavitalea sp.]